MTTTHRPPSVLYKYCPPARIDIFENFAVRFSPPSEFNDTFDTEYSGRVTHPEELKQQRKPCFGFLSTITKGSRSRDIPDALHGM